MQGIDHLSSLHRYAKRSSDSSGNQAPSPRQKDFRAIFISDVHLGTKDSHAGELNQFLKQYSTEKVYLVGDILDGWRMKSGIFWSASFNRIIRRFLKLARQGIPIIYITGNHDEFLRKYANNRFDQIHILNKTTHVTARGKRLLVIHGDQFEGVTHCSRLLKLIGDHGYEFLMFLNRQFNRIRARYGYGYWSFSGFLKQHITRAQTYIGHYEEAVAYGAKKQGYDGVICGHIHHAAMKTIAGIEYLNTGDWVESCTAIVEEYDGSLRLIRWLDDPNRKAHKSKKQSAKTTKAKPLKTPIS